MLSLVFSTQPAYVNLSDLHWTNEGGSGNFDPVPVSLEGSVVESVHSGIDASGANERLDFEQRESRKLTETLRKEKLMERQVRERLLNEVAADKEARRKTHRSMPSSSSLNTTLTDIPRTTHGSSEPQNRIKIKLILFDRPNVPFVIDLDSSDSYADFLSSIQSLLLANPPERNVPATDVLQATDPALQALDRHLQSLSATDICVRLLVHTWPRRELSHPCASSSNPDPILTAQQLTKMQITNGTTIAVRHVNCPFQLRVMEKIDELSDLHPRIGQEFITPVDPHLEQPEPQPPVALAPREEDEDFPMEPIFVDDPHLNPCFPGQGQQLHPRPPGRALPTSALSVQENVRRAALNLAERLRPTSTESVPFDQGSESSSWTQVPTLVKICLNAIRTWVTQYAEAFSAARVGLINELDSRQPFSSRATASNQSDGAAIHRRRLEQWVAHHLSGMQWPDVLGQLLVQSLIDEKCFTARTAVLLRNCVSALDLRHYILTSTDLIQCLADRWTGLVSLHLDSDHPFQIATEGIYALKRLQNLTSLSLCGLHSVSDETLPYLLGKFFPRV
ncbi:hypothetical protein D915_010561 [Fasciola hepatica]|uniref:Uncharacterized protein n=1 Tax=Fasciola hepatica TaxID=6192 RepID=A0A4E0QT66_FASHE|nr:hypothetical protein D915_010561 [Fasciola hepatica]